MNSTYNVNDVRDFTKPVPGEDEMIKEDCPEEIRPEIRKLVLEMKKEIDARESPDDFRFTLDDFEIGCPLGRGKFGRVYLAREKKTKFFVALKTLHKSELTKYKMGGQLIRELEINIHLKHPNILQFYTFFDDHRRIFLILEYAGKGDLFGILQKQKNCRFPEPQSADYIYQVASALDYCHSRKVMHRDIKPENLLLSADDKIKLADFGWSVHAPSNKRKTLCGTLDYLPPEMINKENYSALIDNWCVGVLLFEFLTGSPPFESRNQEETYNKISKLIIKYPSYLSQGSIDVIKSLLKLKPSERMSLKKVMEHPWINTQMKIPYPKPPFS